MKARYPIILLFLITALCSLAKVSAPLPAREGKGDAGRTSRRSTSSRPKGTLIHLLHADELYYNQRIKRDAQILVGNVRFRHDNVILTCDSALYFQGDNSFDAFGHVKMNQADTLTLVSDILYYDGTAQLAQARHNVILTHRKSRLYCDSLDYDRLYDLGYFFNGGKLVDEENTLTSEWGQYSPSTREAIFNYNVDLQNPKFTLVSDTLHYNTGTGFARIVGPSNVDNGDNHIYSENGTYDTHGNRAYLLNRSIVSNLGSSIEGDSLYYQGDSALSKAYGNVIYIDKDNRNEFRGNYALYSDSLGYAEAADSAVFIDYSQRDTFYIHADSFKLITHPILPDTVPAQETDKAKKKDTHTPPSVTPAFKAETTGAAGNSVSMAKDSLAVASDSIAEASQDSTVLATLGSPAAVIPDSPAAAVSALHSVAASDSLSHIDPDPVPVDSDPMARRTSTQTDSVPAVPKDSVWRELRAYHHVRAYRVDVQAVCDSMVFHSIDSCLTMYHDPILWQQGQQLLGEEIKAWMNDSTIDSTYVILQALSVERIDSMCYNQVTGNLMRSYFRDGQMHYTVVEQNVLVNYFPFDSDSLMIGMIHAEGNLLKLFMDKKKVQKIMFDGEAEGRLHPLALIQPKVRYLDNFAWFDYVRPLNKDDIFNWRPKREGTELKKSVQHTKPKSQLPTKGGKNTKGKSKRMNADH